MSTERDASLKKATNKDLLKTAEEAPPDPSVTAYVNRYFANTASESDVHAQMIKKAYTRVRNKERSKYRGVIGVLLILIIASASYIVWQQQYRKGQEAKALALFDLIKQNDVKDAELISLAIQVNPDSLPALKRKIEQERRERMALYDGYIKNGKLIRTANEEERLIIRSARLFNESDIGIPESFVDSVKQAIAFWQTKGRTKYINSIRLAEERGYTSMIVQTMMKYGLAPEFFYLALQESEFNYRAVGPATRWGYAKGMWQFIPDTGERYHLVPGPKKDLRVFDQLDDRHNVEKATEAAAAYLSDIYRTLANASSLLVIASYNWGEHRVIRRLDELDKSLAEMQNTSEDRNYWNIYTRYNKRIPEETKDYVLKIFAAAVIGQNPEHFGFNMDNPLQRHVDEYNLQTFGPNTVN